MSAEPLWITVEQHGRIESSKGGAFYAFNGVDAEGNPATCKTDERFQDLIQPELDALNEGEPVELCVVPDPFNAHQYRISLTYYKERKEMARSVPATPAAVVVTPEETFAPGASKSITLNLPMKDYAFLRESHRRLKDKYSRFGDYNSALFSRYIAGLRETYGDLIV